MKLTGQAGIGLRGAAAAAIIIAALSVPAAAAAGGIGSAMSAVESAPLAREEKEGLLRQVQAAHQAGVPADDIEIIVARGLARGVKGAVLGRFLETASRVAQQGLPVRPVLDRIELGLSKGIPPERIDAAGSRLADGLAAAGPLVDGLAQKGLRPDAGNSRNGAIESVARAYEQSLTDDRIRALGERVRENGQSLDQFDRAVRALSFLAGSGMGADAADRIARACVERNFAERDYGRLERTVSDMVHQGRTMDEIVRAADREVREIRGHGEGRENGKQERGGGRDAGGRGGRGR